MTLGSLDLFDETLFEIAAIQKSRQRIGDRKLLEFTRLIFEDGAIDRDRDLRGDRLEQLEISLIE